MLATNKLFSPMKNWESLKPLSNVLYMKTVDEWCDELARGFQTFKHSTASFSRHTVHKIFTRPTWVAASFSKRATEYQKVFERKKTEDLQTLISLWILNIQKAYNFSKQFILLIRLKHKISKEEFMRVAWNKALAVEWFCMEKLPGRRFLH